MTSERREGIVSNSDIQIRPNMAPAGPDLGRSPSWEEILAADPDHEPLLDTPEGRFEAVLNVVKNGAMVLEVIVMDGQLRKPQEVSKAVNDACGFKVVDRRATSTHFEQTLSTFGVVRSREDQWQLTPFGQFMKPGLNFAWQKFSELGVDPQKALGSKSRVKKNEAAQITGSSPYRRAKILFELESAGDMKEFQLRHIAAIGQNSIHQMLIRLREAGFIGFESVDVVSSYTTFKLAKDVNTDSEWPVFRYRGSNYTKLSVAVRLAIETLTYQGATEFTTSDILNWISRNTDTKGVASDSAYINKALNFLCNPDVGVLQRSALNENNMSRITLTPAGMAFNEKVLKPLREWAEDSNSIIIGGQLRENLSQNQTHLNDMLNSIAQRYEDTSPDKKRDFEAKCSEVMALITNRPGILTPNEVARILRISNGQVYRVVKSLINNGRIEVAVGKMGRKYLSMATQVDSGDSVDKEKRN